MENLLQNYLAIMLAILHKRLLNLILFLVQPTRELRCVHLSISQSLFVNHQLNKPYAFNRKEKKDHGDMGQFVGCDISGSALIVDDVVSSGSSIIESIDLINEKKSKCHDVLVAFDRMEIGTSKMASLELHSEYNTVVHSIINLDDIADVVKSKSEYKSFINAMNDYMSTYRSV